MSIVSSPSYLFDDLPGYSFQPNYVEVNDNSVYDDSSVKMHYVDYGEKNKPIIMMLHGEPTWSYLYRNLIIDAEQAGFRVIAPDLIGFGKSDKYITQDAYTYANHLEWLTQFLTKLQLKNIRLICQDWGGLLGLRLVAQFPDLFSAVVAANTMLPTGDHKPPQAFLEWQQYSQTSSNFDIGGIIQRGTHKELIEEVLAAYRAPFPLESHKAGVRKFPMLVPISPNDPESANNRQAWQSLSQFKKPFLTLFSDQDPVTKGGEKIFQKLVPGCKGQNHKILQDGGHFLQEDCSKELIQLSTKFFNENI